MMDQASPAAPTTPAEDIDQRIAARVRALRAAQSLTLEALAQQSGVSRSMISRVERGESSPTAVLLEKLARALGTSLASLFDAPAAAPSPLLRRADQTPWRDPATGYVRCNLSPPGVGSLQLVEVTFPPGARIAYENGPRTAAIDQLVWVIEGSIEVGSGTADTRHRLEAGDCLAMRLDAPTSFRNPTRKPARYIVAIGATSSATSKAPP